MKKNYLFVIAIATAALTGCSQDELAEFNLEANSGFTAMLETIESRTILDENNKVKWVKGVDYVSLFEKVDINAKYQVSDVDANGTATLKYVDHIENDNYQSLDMYYAIYPYSDNNTIATENGTITAPVSGTYTFKDKESCIESALMVARSDSKKLTFTNAQGIIRLKLNAETPYVWGKIQSISFTSTANYLNGTATMSWETSTPSAVIASGDETNKSLTVNLDGSLIDELPSQKSGNYAEYYFPIVPTTFGENDLTMTVTFANDKTYTKKVSSGFTIGRKEIITLKHTIGADDFLADTEDELMSDEVYNEVQLLKALQASVNKPVNITLMNNITLTGNWTPVGNKDNNEYFMGTLNGNGFEISGLNVVEGDYVSLISAAKDATIKNLKVSGTVQGDNAAGIVARIEGNTIIENCVSNVIVSGTIKAGGIVSNVTGADAQIINSVNNGDIFCSKEKDGGVGGIIGYVNGNATVDVIGCTNNGNVTGTDGQDTGAVVGYAGGNSSGLIEGFKNTGIIIGPNHKGDGLGRWIETKDNIILAGYCATPSNWIVKYTDENGNVYTLKEGKLKLTKVSETYTNEKLIIPEGVNALSGKLLNGNTVIKEVVIPAGLTDFGGVPNNNNTGASGGFFYNSAVEKVTLPEGMTEIPVGAFNQAANLKEINIPSSVTTIGINAFAGSGLEKLYIPATVANIGYGAFRDMANLTTVTIETDQVHIPNYAFRACAKLTAVYLKVNTLTLGENMIFTNTSTNNENPNNITIYVYNDDVYNTLTGNGNVKCSIVKVTSISNSNDLESAVSAGGTVNIELAAGTYGMPTTNGDVTIYGTKETIIKGNDATAKNVTFNGVTVQSTGHAYTGIKHSESVVYNDVTIVGNMYLYAKKVVFNNCTFDLTNTNDYIWVYAATEV